MNYKAIILSVQERENVYYPYFDGNPDAHSVTLEHDNGLHLTVNLKEDGDCYLIVGDDEQVIIYDYTQLVEALVEFLSA